MTEPAVGASTCASGSQVWTGHIGIFTAKEAKEREPEPGLHARRELMRQQGREYQWSRPARYIAIMASSISTEPSSV